MTITKTDTTNLPNKAILACETMEMLGPALHMARICNQHIAAHFIEVAILSLEEIASGPEGTEIMDDRAQGKPEKSLGTKQK